MQEDTTAAATQTTKPGESRSEQTEVTDAAPEKDAPFFQLYVQNEAQSRPVGTDEVRVQLQRAPARPCATLLEVLYVPMGRSGSASASYLLFEERDEFEAAQRAVPMLDVAPLPPEQAAREAPFEAGVGLYYTILAQPIPDRESVEACKRRLSEAASGTLSSVTARWAASMLAGRLASEYTYDFDAARSFFAQAERIAAPDSLEEMSARFWKADALVLAGRKRDAQQAYEQITKTYRAWPRSQVVRRSADWLRMQ